MSTSRKLRCAALVMIAVIALVITGSQAMPYLSSGSGAYASFWSDTKVTPGSRFITTDILILSIAVWMLMVIEARRHGIRFVWAYIVGAVVIGICVVFPIFLVARELRLDNTEATKIHAVDTILLVLFGVANVGMAVWVAAG